jgi:hypothetical protein
MDTQQTLEHAIYEVNEKLNWLQIEKALTLYPKKEWVEKIEELNGYKYLPIDKVEWLLSRLFPNWSADITHVVSDDKKCIVAVSINYKIGDTTYKRPGVGCCDVSGQHTSATAFPTAKSIAVRDAAEMIGNIFGANLNRKNVPVPVKEKPQLDEKVLGFANMIADCTSVRLLDSYFKGFEMYKDEPYYGQIKALYIKKKTQLINR